MEESVRTIYVDLDHTLVRVDLLRERLLLAILRNPLLLFESIYWLLRGGRPRLKTEIARRTTLDLPNLPYHHELLAFLKEEKESGTSLILATAAPLAWAQSIADHLGIFDHVLATDETTGNLKGRRKLAMIQKDANGKPFGYAGDASVDRVIFEASRLPIVVNSSASLAGKQSAQAIVIRQKTSIAPAWWRSLRLHQWSKNILIFFPAIAAHQLSKLWPDAVLAFGAFSLVASGFYLLNDFWDIDLDRQHPKKKFRGQASGALCPSHALLLVALLFLIAAAASFYLPKKFGLILVGYGALNLLYSAVLKHVVGLDLITLALFYSLRIFAGGAACDVFVSAWLFAFIFFLALSLAHLKRYTELAQQLKSGLGAEARPTYSVKDISVLKKIGLTSGLASVLVLSLYIISPQTAAIYKTPALLFIVCAFLFYWLERIWSKASRGGVHGDPIVFMVTDFMTYLIAIATTIVIWVASVY
jgi:4-hydroxybenzoate polyprenyltransferase